MIDNENKTITCDMCGYTKRNVVNQKLKFRFVDHNERVFVKINEENICAKCIDRDVEEAKEADNEGSWEC